jgi:hypothetical protein
MTTLDTRIATIEECIAIVRRAADHYGPLSAQSALLAVRMLRELQVQASEDNDKVAA